MRDDRGRFRGSPRGSASATSPIRQTAPHSGQVISQPSPSRSRTGVARQAHGAPAVISMRCGVILRPLHGGGPFAPSGAHYPPPGSRASTSGALDAGQDAPRRRRGQLTGHLPALSRRTAAPETTGAGRTPRAGQPWSPPPTGRSPNPNGQLRVTPDGLSPSLARDRLFHRTGSQCLGSAMSGFAFGLLY